MKFLLCICIEYIIVALHEHMGEGADGAERTPQVVGDGVIKTVKFLVGKFQLLLADFENLCLHPLSSKQHVSFLEETKEHDQISSNKV